MPDVVPAIREMVPVGAIDVSWAFRSGACPRGGVPAAAEVGERAAFLGEFHRSTARFAADQRHEPACQAGGAGARVGDAQCREELGEPHDPETDLACAPGGLFQCRVRVAVHLDHVVKEADRQPHPRFEPLLVDPAVRDEPGEVDRAERARLVGQQRHLSARVRRLDPAVVG
jgi:hypothetical protein